MPDDDKSGNREDEEFSQTEMTAERRRSLWYASHYTTDEGKVRFRARGVQSWWDWELFFRICGSLNIVLPKAGLRWNRMANNANVHLFTAFVVLKAVLMYCKYSLQNPTTFLYKCRRNHRIWCGKLMRQWHLFYDQVCAWHLLNLLQLAMAAFNFSQRKIQVSA